ncbi:Protein-N(pi)-phosphohistidine--sugarphosphotran sferase [Coriobacterium glomerans PW2]|uniref:PTS system mannose-specific EIIAB component n=1 Tax=Coriobacterium glomerans (strain ATCC 49209 / DSM 20642 / JCM 10262 / PW2) TaxID=700015 RepID=F2N810_CORGP|nr:PTS sugar transporter subunit IIB [Coriobacterium glomerans]AEB07119.1 Protein-N(pi)-phosphohistidine--sugarphosphotran sferase [Coriobacterium glomerans PW2]
MVGIVLASHGTLADGIRQTGSMVFGDQQAVASVSLAASMGPDDFRSKVEEALASFDDRNEVLFLVDLWGGTPFNQISAICKEHESWAVLTGLNLPMLIEAYSARPGAASAHALAAHVVQEARRGVRVLPENLDAADTRSKGPQHAQKPSGAQIPEGTVLGDGHIKFVLVRIDTRLLHGQVATTWTKTSCPDRIIVVSDNVASDALRKSMIEQAAPPGVRVNVVPIDKMIEVARDPRFGDTKAMLLFETPEDLLRAVEGGLDIKKVNLGSIAHSQGKVVITNSVSMGRDDVTAFEGLLEHGIEFDARKVPNDSAGSFKNMLNKAKSELHLS